MCARLNTTGSDRHWHSLFLIIGGAIGIVLFACVFVAFFKNPTGETFSRSRSPDKQPRSAVARASDVSVIERDRSERIFSPIDRLAQKHNVRKDDWDSEQLSEALTLRLTELQNRIVSPNPIQGHEVESLITDEFRCQELRPKELSEVMRQGPIRVLAHERSAAKRVDSGELDLDSDYPFLGAAGFAEALQQLIVELGPKINQRVKFKLFRIQTLQDTLVTHVRFEASNASEFGSGQQTAIWICHWTLPNGKQTPKLVRIALDDFEEVHISLPGGHLFVDCTESVLGNNATYAQQVIPGVNHWLKRIPREFMGPFGHHGIAMGDVNGDGLDDLYVCDAGGLPNRLYLQQPDGTAVDRSSQCGVDILEDSTSALLIDLDNDGDQDLAVGTDPVLRIAENNGRGVFSWRASIDVGTDSLSICAADYDIDGYLDIYVCGYNVRKQDPTRRGLPFPLPFHDANNGGRNLLLKNNGAFQFMDVTEQAGLEDNNTRFSMAASWEDFDNDGDLDLYVANDFGRNNLYRNEGGKFSDIASTAGVEDHATGMSVSWGDYNRDGHMDVYVGNMFSAAGNRVTYQRRFEQGIPSQTITHLRRMARGNTLFANLADAGATFRDVSEQADVTMGRWAWGSKFVDLNNDGWQDLVVANGYVTGDNADDL